MAKINRKYIDKHWAVFVLRSLLAGVFGFLLLFGGMADMEGVVVEISIFLLLMGIVDSVSALYNSTKKRGFAKSDLTASVMVLSIYTILSGVIDLFHGFVSTVEPTDRFIRVLAGVCGCVIGIVIFNAGDFELTTFVRFFGAYMLIVGVTSLIYGAHNRAQNIEDKIARSQSAKKKTIKKRTVKK